MARGGDSCYNSVSARHDWTSGDFETWQGRLKGKDAAVQILLPIASVAFGMTLFAIIMHFTIGGA